MADERTPLFPLSPESDTDDDSSSEGTSSSRETPRILRLSNAHEGFILQSKSEESRAQKEKDDDDDEEEDEDDAPVVQSETNGEEATDTTQEQTQAQDGEFEQIMQQMGSEYAGAASGEEVTDPGPEEGASEVEFPPLESPEDVYEIPLTSPAEDAPEDDSTTVKSAAILTPPPPPPIVPVGGYNAYPPTSPNNTPLTPWANQVANTPTAAELNDAEYYAEKRGLRRGLVAGFITGYVVKAYLARRKQQRLERESEKRLNERDKQIDFLQSEQYKASERAKAAATAHERERYAHAEELKNLQKKTEQQRQAATPEALPEIKMAGVQERLLDEEGNEIVLPPGWELQHSAGGYSVVVNERGQVMYDAIPYGNAYRLDRRAEQVNEAAFTALGDDVVAGQSNTDRNALAIPLSSRQGNRVGPDESYRQQQEVDIKHRLPEPRNNIASIFASPWLWTAAAILLIVYFIAALA